MSERKVRQKDEHGFRCPIELLIRGWKEENEGYVLAFRRMGELADPRTPSLLGKIISDGDNDRIRSYCLTTLAEAFPEIASSLIEHIIQNKNDELGSTAYMYLRDGIDVIEPVRISGKVLERLVSSSDPVLRKRSVEILSGIRSVHSSELLVRLLDDPESSTRRVAAKCLGERGYGKAVSSLKNLLNEIDPDVRSTAIVSLAKLGDRSVIPDARDLMKGDLWSFLSAIEALYLLGELTAKEVLDRIIEELNSLDAYMYCQEASWMVCRIADEGFRELIIGLAEKGEGIARQLAYECLCMFEDGRIDDMVLREAENSSVCEEILEHLPRLHDPKALDLLLNRFDRGILPDGEALWRLHSIVQNNLSSDDVHDDRIRERLKDEETIERILTTLYGFYAKLRLIEERSSNRDPSIKNHFSEKHLILRIASLLRGRRVWTIFHTMFDDPFEPVRVEAAVSYADIDLERALKALLKLLISTDNASLRWDAAGHIAEKWGNRPIDELIEILNNEDEEKTWPVIEILGYLKCPDAVLSLKPMLKHSDWWIRASAVRALGRIGDPSVIPDLSENSTDASEHVRYRVEEAIRNLEDRKSQQN